MTVRVHGSWFHAKKLAMGRVIRVQNLPCIGLSKKTDGVFFHKTTCHDTTKRRPALPVGLLDGQRLCAHADTMVDTRRGPPAVLGGGKCTIFHCFQGDLIMTLLESSDFSVAHFGALA